MFIKLKTLKQFKLLQSLNPFLGKHSVPFEVIDCIYHLLVRNNLGKKGEVIVFLTQVDDDGDDIFSELEYERSNFTIPDNGTHQIKLLKPTKLPKKRKKWSYFDIDLSNGKGKTYIVYSMTYKRSVELGEENLYGD